jgi:hypothetical protein
MHINKGQLIWFIDTLLFWAIFSDSIILFNHQFESIFYVYMFLSEISLSGVHICLTLTKELKYSGAKYLLHIMFL